MCGIVTAIARRNIVPVLIEGLRKLEYRGYDSAGLAVMDGGGMIVTKAAGKVAVLSDRTRAEWPVAMRIETEGLSLRLEPLFDDQELDSRATTGNVYWEGAVTVFDDRRGDGRRIGLGYLELTGYHERLRL